MTRPMSAPPASPNRTPDTNALLFSRWRSVVLTAANRMFWGLVVVIQVHDAGAESVLEVGWGSDWIP